MTSGPDMLFFWPALLCYLGATVGASFYVGLRRRGIRTAVFWLTVAGFASNTVGLAVRGALSGHPPVTNLFEYLSLFAWATVLGFLILWRRSQLKLVTIFGSTVAFAMMVIASCFPARIEQQLMPALQSYWLYIHVSVAALAEAAFAVAFVSSVLYLVGCWRGWDGLPGRAALDMLSYRAVGIGFPLFTIGALFAGAVWAQSAWGRPWSWDPKETCSLVVWLIYAVYLHARLLAGWRGRRAAVLCVAGFGATVFTVLGSQILGGLHSYG